MLLVCSPSNKPIGGSVVLGLPRRWRPLMEESSRFLDWLQVPNVASQVRHCCAQPVEALQLLCHQRLR